MAAQTEKNTARIRCDPAEEWAHQNSNQPRFMAVENDRFFRSNKNLNCITNDACFVYI
jgi:hypothetical protein